MKEVFSYFRRIFKVYLTGSSSYLDFWHEEPEVNEPVNPDKLNGYYMTFEDKAKYTGPRDEDGVILFDYHSDIGVQYNPVAIAQYGLGNFNLYLETENEKYLEEARKQADWLVENLEENEEGFLVWKHHFKWHYKETLSSGWYSCLSQGSGISLLVRMHEKTDKEKYLKAAQKAFEPMTEEMEKGGVKYTDEKGQVWLEEYMVNPPTHILNGFIWALWGVHDFYLATDREEAKKLFEECVETLDNEIESYDAGFWSLYDQSDQLLDMIASPFYHKLHITQLKATYELTGRESFKKYAKIFEGYQNNWLKRNFAFVYKAIFKLFYF
ncbi:MAG: D-glucuronyl C5-epimerase family protein [Candidatus Magasanikbacteria bacterium]